jgi:hypothetical protein
MQALVNNMLTLLMVHLMADHIRRRTLRRVQHLRLLGKTRARQRHRQNGRQGLEYDDAKALDVGFRRKSLNY